MARWTAARKIFELAGVAEDQIKEFMNTIVGQFPYPSAEDLFLEHIDAPLLAAALGERKRELSFYKTGVPELTADDLQLFKECLRDWSIRVQTNPADREKLLKTVLGSF